MNELRQKHPNIEIVLVLAYLPTEKGGKDEERSCTSTIYPEGLELVPQRFAITYRNRWIVEQSDYLIAYVRSSHGGSYEALKNAKRKGKRIVNLAD